MNKTLDRLNILGANVNENKDKALETPQNETHMKKRESNIKIKQYVNEWLWLCFNKTLFTKISSHPQTIVF